MENNDAVCGIIDKNVNKFPAIVHEVCKRYSTLYLNSIISVEIDRFYTMYKHGKSITPNTTLKISSSSDVLKSDFKYSLLEALHDGLSNNDSNYNSFAITRYYMNGNVMFLRVMLCTEEDLKNMGSIYYSSLNYEKIVDTRNKEQEYLQKMEEARYKFKEKHKILAKIKDFLNL